MKEDRHNISGLLILMLNLGILGLTLKLYTEYFKDRSQYERRNR